MKLIITETQIESCCDCPHCGVFTLDGKPLSNKNVESMFSHGCSKRLEGNRPRELRMDVIPNWCPLPDAVKEQGGKK